MRCPARARRLLLRNGYDLLDDVDEPIDPDAWGWCYRSRSNNRRFINAETDVSSSWASRINLS